MPPKEREATGSAGRPTPPKPVEESPKKETPRPAEPVQVEQVKESPKTSEAPEFVAVTAIKYGAPDGTVRMIPADADVTGFTEAEMVAFYEMGSIRRK